MPSVISLTLVCLVACRVNRTWYPTVSPSSTPISCAMRAATVRAARRRGWVCPMRLRPASSAIFGSCVVLPDPVSPATTTTWLRSMRSRISSTAALMGRLASNVIVGWAVGMARPCY